MVHPAPDGLPDATGCIRTRNTAKAAPLAWTRCNSGWLSRPPIRRATSYMFTGTPACFAGRGHVLDADIA
ncbi:hypothetical protein NSU_2805 [Novosphingobium pentaromativorans US6-1]|uniref:Uncharacterized protein n=1 Tax=Novosphingobium pentaromativorans US6-1 TaxID=1088721 RepID=G6EEN4_9SPHN|nr:hypothetical protein NSU_2805 [Novosphingobium pentaromativorans US6-1]